MIEIPFFLNFDEGWPPVSIEWLYLDKIDFGYRLRTVPLFVLGLSVGDVISIEMDDEGRVINWSHISKSNRSTVWIMVHDAINLDLELDALRNVGCNTESLDLYNYYSVDVPENISIDYVDKILKDVDAKSVSIAYPSLRGSVK